MTRAKSRVATEVCVDGVHQDAAIPTNEAIATRIRGERLAQGLTATVSDPSTLQKLAVLLSLGTARP